MKKLGTNAAIDDGQCKVMASQSLPENGASKACRDLCNLIGVHNLFCSHVSLEKTNSSFVCKLMVCEGEPTISSEAGAEAYARVCGKLKMRLDDFLLLVWE